MCPVYDISNFGYPTSLLEVQISPPKTAASKSSQIKLKISEKIFFLFNNKEINPCKVLNRIEKGIKNCSIKGQRKQK